MNHNGDEITVDLGHRELTDLLQGRRVSGAVALPSKGVLVLRE